MTQLIYSREAVRQEARFLLRNALTPPLRPYLQFAEEEIVLPSGKYRNQRYRGYRQPAIALWFAELDSRHWRRHVATGPSQSGKSLNCFVIPICYCLFEKREDVIVGLPDMRMSNRKWFKDILPVIKKTRYRDLLPDRGAGSRGGEVTDVRFKNGATLTFMSGGGSDKARAGDTAPNLIVTETDGLDTASLTSREADPLKQLEARTLSFDESAFIVMECTLSTEAGRTWQEIQAGTASRIVRPCPKCEAWVAPEREHFTGWEGAQDEIEAGKLAAFHCPACGSAWTDEERFAAAQHAKLLHRGQSIDAAGDVQGDPPATRTLGFRWSAVDNPFRSSEMLGQLEWKASRDPNEDNADREMRQFQWAIPYVLEIWDETPLDPYALAGRIGTTPRGLVPAWCEYITVGVDVAMYKIHYVVTAWRSDGAGMVIDYNELKVFGKKQSIERAIMNALRYLRDKILSFGYAREDGGELVLPDYVFVDRGYKKAAVDAFIRESNATDEWNRVFWPVIGRGTGKQYAGRYNQPANKTDLIPYVAQDFYLKRFRKEGVAVFELNADAGKSWVHQRLATPCRDEEGVWLDEPGALSLFIPAEGDHAKFAKHLTAEKETQEFIQGKGVVTVWLVLSKVNHYFDALYYAGFGARFCGVEVAQAILPPPPVETPSAPTQDYDPGGFTTPGGRPWM